MQYMHNVSACTTLIAPWFSRKNNDITLESKAGRAKRLGISGQGKMCFLAERVVKTAEGVPKLG